MATIEDAIDRAAAALVSELQTAYPRELAKQPAKYRPLVLATVLRHWPKRRAGRPKKDAINRAYSTYKKYGGKWHPHVFTRGIPNYSRLTPDEKSAARNRLQSAIRKREKADQKKPENSTAPKL